MTPLPGGPAAEGLGARDASRGRRLHPGNLVLPGVLLLFGWGACSLFLFESLQHRNSDDTATLRGAAADDEARIVSTFTEYTHGLDAAASYLSAFEGIYRTQWQEFASALDLEDRYPGFKGIGVIYPVRESELGAFLRAVRSDGVPDFALHPLPGQVLGGEEHAVVTYIEPEEVNRMSLGLDEFSEPHRRETAQRVRDLGVPLLTRRLVLFQDRNTGDDTGLLLFMPVYRKGMPTKTLEDRRAAFVAWTFTPFVFRELLPSIFDSKKATLRLQFYCGTEAAPDSLMFSSDPDAPSAPTTLTTHLELGGQTFTLCWAPGPDFTPTSLSPQVSAALIGALASVLLSVLVFNLGSRSVDLEREVLSRTSELHRSQQRYRAYIDHASEGLFVHDGEGRIVEVNRTACTSLGYTRDELLRLTVFGIEVDIPQDKLRSGWRMLAQGNSQTIRGRHRRKDRATFPVEVQLCCFDLDGQQYYLALTRDITERERAEKALRQSDELLRQAQKMEAVGQLAGGVAHDFNNILTAFMLNLSSLQGNSDLSPEVRACVEELEHEASRAAALTRQLLYFSRRQAINMVPLDLNSLISNLLKMLRRLLGEQITIELLAAEGLPRVKADPGMIDQVLVNLCVNARDAMQDGGQLVLTTDLAAFGGVISAKNPEGRKGLFVRLSVGDSGSGISDDVRSHLFEPFYTTKEQGKGTGLGLATVYGIVRQHDGWIGVDTEKGRGTTFHVFLPALTDDAVDAPLTAPAEAPRGKSETILVVEDEDSIRIVIEQTLKRFGYATISARNGPEAVQLWWTYRDRITLVVTDMVMPGGMDGASLVRTLREKAASSRFIIVTGYTPDPAAMTDLEVPILIKPFDTPALLKAIRRALD